MSDLKNSVIFIITGLSGSGKSTAIAAFEDSGYYCVDNMPVALLPKFLELPVENMSGVSGLAFVMDLREKGFASRHAAVFAELAAKGYDCEIIFLEADEAILVRRYSQTRRHHPFAGDGSLIDGIQAERVALAGLRTAATKIINTSHSNLHELKSVITAIARKSRKINPLRLGILSFGFKHGIPHEADLVIDVRFLRNPYFVPDLKPRSGEDPEVAAYVLETTEARVFLEKYLGLLDYLIPLYKREGKAYLTIGVGCTGGRHRSVAISRFIFDHISKQGFDVGIAHRDKERH